MRASGCCRSRTAGFRRRATWRSRVSRGEFIAILDSDDIWEPTYLAEQLAVFARQPEVDIVTGNGWFLGSRLNGQLARPFPDSRPQPTLQTILADETSIFIMSMFRRRVYEAIGGFDEALRTNEDYDYWLRAALAGFRFWRNDRPLCYYRRRDDSVSAIDVNMLAGILRVYRKLRPLLQDRPAELRDRSTQQVARFERELLAAHARIALTTGDTAGSRQPPVGALRARRRTGHRRGQLHGPAHAKAAGARLPVAPRLSRSDVVAASSSLGRTLARRVALGVRRVDQAVGRLAGGRRILVEARTPLNLAVIRPVLDRLRSDPRIRLQFTGSDRADLRAAFEELGVAGSVIGRDEATWTRFDLYVNADPWEAVALRRVSRQLNFFHGVAGKYNLDCPADLPLGFDRYDAVAFPNAGRRDAYVAAGIVPADRARLIGYPKIDVLVNGRARPAPRRRRARARSGAADGHLRADVFACLGAQSCRRGDHRGAPRRRLQRHREAARPLARPRSPLHRRRELARAPRPLRRAAFPAGGERRFDAVRARERRHGDRSQLDRFRVLRRSIGRWSSTTRPAWSRRRA